MQRRERGKARTPVIATAAGCLLVALAASPAFAGQGRDCDIQLTCGQRIAVGQDYTFTADGVPGGGTYSWSVDQPGGQLAPTGGSGPAFTVTALEPSDSLEDVTVTVTYTAPGGDQCSADCPVTVTRFVIRQATFGGSAFHAVTKDCSYGTCPAYETPHWLDLDLDGDATGSGEHQSPVSYVRGSDVVLSDVEFDIKPVDLGANTVIVQGFGPDGQVFHEVAAMMDGEVVVPVSMTSSQPLPNTVRFYDTYDIEWKIALNNMEILPAGVSSTPMYVTLSNPSGKRLESWFDISTRAADGTATVEDAIDAIWEEFTTLHVENAHGEVMGYYRDILCASYCTVYDAQRLVVQLNGQCGAWRDLLGQCLNTQGVTGGLYVTVEPLSSPGFLVRNYEYADGEGTSGCGSYPYRFNSPCGGPYWPSGTVEVFDLDGLEGQDESNPASWFARHFILKLNGKYYDPSYGVGPIEGTKEEANLIWEQGGIEGYYGYCSGYYASRKDQYEVRETWFDK